MGQEWTETPKNGHFGLDKKVFSPWDHLFYSFYSVGYSKTAGSQGGSRHTAQKPLIDSCNGWLDGEEAGDPDVVLITTEDR